MKFPGRFKTLLGLILLVGWAAGCSPDDVQNKKFADLGSLKSSGYLSQGWIPACLPNPSTEILECHNQVTKSGWVFFQTDRAGLAEFKQHLASASKLPSGFGSTLGPQTPYWWPKESKGPSWVLDCGKGANPTPPWFVSLDEQNLQAYLWRNM